MADQKLEKKTNNIFRGKICMSYINECLEYTMAVLRLDLGQHSIKKKVDFSHFQS